MIRWKGVDTLEGHVSKIWCSPFHQVRSERPGWNHQRPRRHPAGQACVRDAQKVLGQKQKVKERQTGKMVFDW